MTIFTKLFYFVDGHLVNIPVKLCSLLAIGFRDVKFPIEV